MTSNTGVISEKRPSNTKNIKNVEYMANDYINKALLILMRGNVNKCTKTNLLHGGVGAKRILRLLHNIESENYL